MSFNQALIDLATRYNGRYGRPWVFCAPRAQFSFGPWKCLVSKGPHLGPYSPRTTQVLIAWPQLPSRFQIRSRLFNSRNPNLPDQPLDLVSAVDTAPAEGRGPPGTGLRGLEESNGKWDDLILSGDPMPMAMRLVTPAVRLVLRQLAELGSPLPAHGVLSPRDHAATYRAPVLPGTGTARLLMIWAENHEVAVVKPGRLKDAGRLDQLVRLATSLLGQMQLALDPNVQFDDRVTLVEEAKCPVCSGAVGHRMVVCLRCQTPHCYDYWLYNGQCGVFGCGESRWAPPAQGIAN